MTCAIKRAICPLTAVLKKRSCKYTQKEGISQEKILIPAAGFRATLTFAFILRTSYFVLRTLYFQLTFAGMPQFTDQLGNSVILHDRPRRIISLVPSQSEFLWEIGLRDELKGISKFCIRPDEMYRSVERVGGTKDLNIEKIRELKPDLIIGNKEENERAQIEQLSREFPVWMSDIYTFDDAYAMMTELARITGKENEGTVLLQKAKASINASRNLFKGQRVAYFIWNRPYMFAGSNTFIDHVLTHLGFTNALGSLERYPLVEIEDLHNALPELCLLSSEPFPFRDIHAKMIKELLPESKVLLVDGEIFSWYGSSLSRLHDYALSLKSRINGKS
jgi:ABC-type Fe3+-hydroxamate transport system substrate-binding protein